MKTFNISEAKAHFSDLVKQAMEGQEVVIAKDNKPLLRLVPIKPLKNKRKPGSGKGEVLYVSGDFDAPLSEFEEDTE